MNVQITETIYIHSREELRAWFEANHRSKREIWLLYPKKSSGKIRIPYNDAVEEAICYGWIDGIEKRYDDFFSAQRFTPRARKSSWSELNKYRARKLLAENRITQEGLAVLPDLSMDNSVFANDILSALKKDKDTWNNFQSFPDYYKQIRIGFIEEVRKNQIVFEKRLRNFIKKTKQNKRFGTVK